MLVDVLCLGFVFVCVRLIGVRRWALRPPQKKLKNNYYCSPVLVCFPRFGQDGGWSARGPGGIIPVG